VDVLHRRDQVRPCGVDDGVAREDLVPTTRGEEEEGGGRGGGRWRHGRRGGRNGYGWAGWHHFRLFGLDWIGFPCEFVCEVYAMSMPPP
jgi:hypothetical protein